MPIQFGNKEDLGNFKGGSLTTWLVGRFFFFTTSVLPEGRLGNCGS